MAQSQYQFIVYIHYLLFISLNQTMATVQHEDQLHAEKHNSLRPNGVVTVDPYPKKGIVSKAVDLIERALVYLMYNAPPSNHYLSGNFAPVHDETPPCADLPVRGSLPVSAKLAGFRVFVPKLGFLLCGFDVFLFVLFGFLGVFEWGVC